jgi:hypothetical protein
MTPSTVRPAPYRVFSFGARPVIAVPSQPTSALRAGIRCFQTETPRRSMYRAYMALSVAGRWDRLIAQTASSPLPTDITAALDEWLATALAPDQRAGAQLVIQWPPQPERGRIYIHVLDSSGTRICFAKVSLDDENDRTLVREAGILAEISALHRSHFDVPSALGCAQFGAHIVLGLSALPAADRFQRSRAVAYPSDAVEEYSTIRRAVDLNALADIGWFGRAAGILNAASASTFKAEIAADTGAWILCRAHGDLSAHNMLHSAGRLWIFDWEESVHDAPVTADRVGFELSRLSRRILRRPRDWPAVVARDAPALSVLPRRDLMLALLFRSLHAPSASAIINNWDMSEGWGRR